MSEFIWGKIKLRHLPPTFNSYKKGDILVFFSTQKTDLFLEDLCEHEIYFNIACGYSQMVYPYEYRMCYLNCETHYFCLNCSKKEKNISFYVQKLHERMMNLQNTIIELFNNDWVEEMYLFYTENGNESSLDEYIPVTWSKESLADNFSRFALEYTSMPSAIRVCLKKL